MAQPLREIYDQMLQPKWVIAMGACSSSGGMFNNYAILQGVDKIVPVDIHVPGCPPRPEPCSRGSSGCRRRSTRASRPPTRSAESPSESALSGVPGFVEERTGHGETTVVVERGGSSRPPPGSATRRASTSSPTSRRRTTSAGTSRASPATGATARARHQQPGSWGLQQQPEPKPHRFSVSYHLLRVESGREGAAPPAQVWCEDGEPCRASSPSGRPPTGTSGRPGT